MAPVPVLTDRTDPVAVPPDRLWSVLADVAAYPTFWPWLRSFDGRRLEAGTTWRGVVVAPGPLRLRIEVHLDVVDPGRSVVAHLGGDLSGPARIEIAPAGTGSTLHLAAALAPERPALRALTRWARPLAQASHDHVITRALTQLTTHLTHD